MSSTEMPDSIPIFPLANVVLFPEVRVPLHLFEPRYRAMAKDALASDQRIGMVAVRPDAVADMAGDPPVFAVGCEGIIEESQPLPDGRFNLVLRGAQCFRILAEDPPDGERLYRVARIERIAESADPEERANIAARKDEVVGLLMELLRRVAPEEAASVDAERLAEIEEVTFVNALAQSLELATPEKQALLEANSVSQRCDRLVAMLRFRLAEQASGETGSDRNVH